MKIATVIVTFGDSPHLAECLKSLKNSIPDGDSNQIIVVDNSRENLGFSGGNNKGVRRALSNGAEAVMLLNDDTKVDPDAIHHLARTLSSNSNIGMVVPKIYFYPGFEYHKERYSKSELGRVIWYAGGKIDWDNCLGVHRGVDEVDKNQYAKSEETEFATGCAVMIKREVFDKVGLLDERYFLYLEDLDFSVRVQRAGLGIVYQPKAVIWHKNAQSSAVGADLHDYFFTRNRLLFGLDHASFKTKLALVRESAKIFLKGNSWQRRGAADFYLRKFGKGSWN